MVSKEDIMYIADIAKLNISTDELDSAIEKFTQLLKFVDKIKEVDTENVEPTYQVNDDTYILKDYEGNATLTREEVLQNTKEQKYGYFKIMKVVE
jgi:aspartyl-tRNA(Asn)/glutamyl-tRNA(Gln) amidotransferase subunit C